MTLRRLIGRRYDDPTVKKDIESWPFKVVDRDGQPQVEVSYLKQTKQFSPQEISSMILMKVGLPRPPFERFSRAGLMFLPDERDC